MIHELNTAPLSTGSALQVTVSGQILNGLVLWASAAWDVLDTLQVTLKSPHHNARALVNTVSMRHLAEISDLEGGFSQTLKGALNVETGDSQVFYPIIVPLGCLQLGANQSELEILLKKGAGTSVQCGIATYLDDEDVDQVFEYYETRDTNDKFTSVRDVFVVCNADLIAHNTKSATIMVQSPFGAQVASVPSLLGYTMAKLRGEVNSPLRVLQAYKSPDPIPDNVNVTITGTDASSFTMIARQVWMDPYRVSRGTLSTVARLAQRVGSKPVAEQKAIKRAGWTPVGNDLLAVQARGNVSPSGL